MQIETWTSEKPASPVDPRNCVLIGENPRIAPVRDELRRTLSGVLGVGMDRITVRATTTDRLGFTGRGEGLAAQAVALLRKRDTIAT